MSLGSWGFRRGLREALTEWVEEGLIGEEVAEALRRRHALETRGAFDAASFAIYLFGALLVFGGLASFVAWNWEAVPPGARLAGGVILMLGFEVSGYRLGFPKASARRHTLGHALVVLGVLVFGANLALLAQRFHFEPRLEGFLAWSAVSASMALALRSTPCAAVAMLTAFAWLLGKSPDEVPGGIFLYQGAWVVAVAWGRGFRSAPLTVLATVCGLVAVAWAAGQSEGSGDGVTALYLVPLSFCVVAIGMGGHAKDGDVGSVAAAPSVLVAMAFIVSFWEVAEGVSEGVSEANTLHVLAACGPPLVLGLLAVATTPASKNRTAPILAIAAAVTLALSAWLGPTALCIAAHLCLIARVAWDLRRSLTELQRGPFWMGVLLAVATIVARFLEIQTGLLTKAVVFVLAGLAVIAAGFFFEQRRLGVRT